MRVCLDIEVTDEVAEAIAQQTGEHAPPRGTRARRELVRRWVEKTVTADLAQVVAEHDPEPVSQLPGWMLQDPKVPR